jgi:hypothetical protein
MVVKQRISLIIIVNSGAMQVNERISTLKKYELIE